MWFWIENSQPEDLIKIKLNFPRLEGDFASLKFGKICWVTVEFYFDIVISV